MVVPSPESGLGRSTEFVELCLARIDEREAEVRAWTCLDRENALSRAARLDGEPTGGPLHGIPVGVKDIFDTADLPTEYGSPIYRSHRPRADAAAVAQLRASGAVIMGKTATTEFATLSPAETRNPHALDHTPGGSSSGSAAAVADGMVPLAIGSQTVASTIRPASYCGVVGFKPSFGVIPFDGAKPLSPSHDTVGLFARDVDGVELLARGLGFATSAAHDPVWWELRGPTIALLRTPWWAHASSDAQRAVERALQLAAAAGATVIEIPLPTACHGLLNAQIALSEYETARSLQTEYVQRREALSEALVDLIERGMRVTSDERRRALMVRETCAQELHATVGDLDACATVAASGEAPVGLDSTGDPLVTRPWTLLGWPAITVPGMRGRNGLPIGVQLIAPRGRDARALAVARWLHHALERQAPSD